MPSSRRTFALLLLATALTGYACNARGAVAPPLPVGRESTARESAPRHDASAVAFFEKKVRPVLVNNCYNCHSANTNSKGGLRVDDRNGLINGGGRGPAVVPGHPEKSLLLRAVRHEAGKLKMPPKKHLSDEQIADLTKWIKDGAAWPAGASARHARSSPSAKYERLRKRALGLAAVARR